MSAIYHITSAPEVERAARAGEYAPAGYEAEGFVHCSYRHQVLGVANVRYRGRPGPVLLEIDRARVPGRVVDENLEGAGSLFPHIYGRVPMSAVVAIHEFPCDGEGGFELPPTVGE
ncbi:MAG TPA: DUF952 domain-containing protein [Candidatus Limnocylindria bacterium]|nr:DUF952 domain-containing protein [Candidatus Limnocylindria bacterium]